MFLDMQVFHIWARLWKTSVGFLGSLLKKSDFLEVYKIVMKEETWKKSPSYDSQEALTFFQINTFQPLSNLFELKNTKIYINFSFFLSHIFLNSLSCFCRLFYQMILIFYSFKGKSTNFGYLFLCVL